MKKKIVFFDGDGTLWYPRKTKWKERPWWVYKDKKISKNPNAHLVLTPTAYSTLKELKKRGVIRILLSTHPHLPKEAEEIINHKVRHFKLGELFDEVHATREYHSSKGEFILEILKKRKIPKAKALMVGDVYSWDYKPARDIGVDALMMDTDYRKLQKNGCRIRRIIPILRHVLDYI